MSKADWGQPDTVMDHATPVGEAWADYYTPGTRPREARAFKAGFFAAEEILKRIHRPRRGETARYAPDDFDHEREPTHFEPYVICDGDGTTWPCSTMRAFGYKSTDSTLDT